MPNVSSTSLPVLCEFWYEDDVWNGEAKDLPIAVFGNTFEEAQAHMRDAIQGHIESAIELGEFSEVLKTVSKAVSGRRLSIDDLQASHPVVKMSVEVKDKQVAVA
ncbi:MAG: hypothetical protein JWO20_2061 [Candidatus Angelobacter sp.]|jgi:predicted RNase H-like HicB family nuclease|nr:hypothetical protein [Candidatus Angelobacter sp.]